MQADLFGTAVATAPRAMGRALVEPPADTPPIEAEPVPDAVPQFRRLLHAYAVTDWHGVPCARLDGKLWGEIMATVYEPLRMRWFAAGRDGRPLPLPDGRVLEHLHKLDIMRVAYAPGGAPLIALATVTAAAQAAAHLHNREPN